MSLEFRPVKEGHAVAEWVKALKGKSGVYVVRERGFLGSVLYVGESHTGRLYSTLLRHFQHWTGPTAGPTFPVSKVELAVIRTPAGKAIELPLSRCPTHFASVNTSTPACRHFVTK